MAIKIEHLDLFTHSYEASCGGGACPKILINDDGDALVQGLLVDEATKKKLTIPEGEGLVFVPNSVIKEFLKQSK